MGATSDPDLTRNLAVLSAMITPTILVLATASLIGATVARLTFAIGTIRELYEEMLGEEIRDNLDDEELDSIHLILDRSVQRIRIMQASIIALHTGIACFVLTMIALGVEAFTDIGLGSTPVLLALTGGLFVLSVTGMLIIDARLGMKNALLETDMIAQTIDRLHGQLGHSVWLR